MNAWNYIKSKLVFEHSNPVYYGRPFTESREFEYWNYKLGTGILEK
jgi:hypothetical protein